MPVTCSGGRSTRHGPPMMIAGHPCTRTTGTPEARDALCAPRPCGACGVTPPMGYNLVVKQTETGRPNRW